MPRVPQYNEPQVDLAPQPGVRVAAPRNDLPAIGADVAQAAGSVGNIVQREQERRNADRLFRTEAQMRDDYIKFETTLRDRRGQNAWGVTTDVEAWFAENGKRYTSELENDAQRTLFEPKLVQLRQSSMESAARFEAQERRVSLEESAKASIASAINIAAASYDNPTAIAAAKRDVIQRVQVQAGFNGWTPERRALEEANTLTTLHTQVLQSMADKDPDAARAYLAANKGEIAGTVHAELEKLVEAGELKVGSQRASDALVAEQPDEAAALKAARENYEGSMRDAVVTRVKQRFADDRATAQAREREVADMAWDFFARGGLDSIPVSVLNELDGRTLNAMKVAETQARITTDWEKYYQLRQMYLEDPVGFAALDLRPEFANIAPAQRETLIDLQRNPKPLPNVVSDEAMLRVAYRQLGLDNDAQKGQLEAAYNQALLTAQQTKGSTALTDPERQEILDKLLIQGEVTGGGLFGLWDPDRRRYQVVGTAEEPNFVPEGDAPEVIPEGIDPELWPYLNPEERKLWQ